MPNDDQVRSWPYPRLDDADPRVALPDTDRQYHIELAPGELAEYILLPGDQDRIERIATHADRHRDAASATVSSPRSPGSFHGRRVSVVSTGIGTDNVEIVLAEILAITTRPTFIRIGSCGVLRDDIELGDLVVTTGAVRLESTTSFFVHDGYPAVADYGAVAALVEAAASPRAHRSTSGITATAPGFYGAQGRPIPQLPIRYPDLAAEMRRPAGHQLRDGGLGAARARRPRRLPRRRRLHRLRTANDGRFVQGEQKDRAEAACIDTGLEALRLLAEMDEAVTAAGARHWRPSLWARTWHPRAERSKDGSPDARPAPPPDPATGREEEGRTMVQAYCVKDKKKVEMNNPVKITMKNGKPATKGTCPKCGNKRLPHRRLTATRSQAGAPVSTGALRFPRAPVRVQSAGHDWEERRRPQVDVRPRPPLPSADGSRGARLQRPSAPTCVSRHRSRSSSHHPMRRPAAPQEDPRG